MRNKNFLHDVTGKDLSAFAEKQAITKAFRRLSQLYPYRLPLKYEKFSTILSYLSFNLVGSEFVLERCKRDNRVPNRYSSIEFILAYQGVSYNTAIKQKLLTENVIPFCLSESLVDAFLKTDLPHGHFPTNENLLALICLPKNKLFLRGKSIPAIVVSIAKESMMIAFSAAIDLESSCFSPDINKLKGYESEVIGVDPDVKGDLEKAISIALHTFLYLSYVEPSAVQQAISMAKKISSVSSKNKKALIYNIPVILGKDYKTKTETAPRGDSTSSNRSPVATHWRRGHWRNQPYGSRAEVKYKYIWIEPILVNACKE